MTDRKPVECWLTDMDGVLVHEERAIPGARLHVFAGAGHVFPLEREPEMVALLGEHFLGGAGVDARAGG